MSIGSKHNLPNRPKHDQVLFIEQGNEYYAKILLDFHNKRLKLLEYDYRNITGLDNLLWQTAGKHKLEKVLISANQADWEKFLARGYVLECLNKFYFNGDPGYHMAKYLSVSRRQSNNPSEADRVLQLALEKSTAPPPPLPEGYTLRPGSVQDIPAMVRLFTQVFPTYPSPVYDPAYLLKSMRTGSSYYLLLTNDREEIVSTISAEIDERHCHAEVTDCSTLPAYRGKGLMSAVLTVLEDKMEKKGIVNLYSIARATSPGINIVFRRHAYTYGGRFIKNCNISGGFEDMSLWFKQLNNF